MSIDLGTLKGPHSWRAHSGCCVLQRCFAAPGQVEGESHLDLCERMCFFGYSKLVQKNVP